MEPQLWLKVATIARSRCVPEDADDNGCSLRVPVHHARDRHPSKGQMMIKPRADGANLTSRLLQIIAEEGLVARDVLEPGASLCDIGVSETDLVLIGAAIEREFDVDILDDTELEQAKTVGELLLLITHRVTAAKPLP